MQSHILPFFGYTAMWVIVALLGFISIALGYWFSDVLYDAGLWPLGALLRIGLLFEVLGLGMFLIMIFFIAFKTLFFGNDD